MYIYIYIYIQDLETIFGLQPASDLTTERVLAFQHIADSYLSVQTRKTKLACNTSCCLVVYFDIEITIQMPRNES